MLETTGLIDIDKEEGKKGLTDIALKILLAVIRHINRLCDEEIISSTDRMDLHEMLVPGIFDKRKAEYMRAYRRDLRRMEMRRRGNILRRSQRRKRRAQCA